MVSHREGTAGIAHKTLRFFCRVLAGLLATKTLLLAGEGPEGQPVFHVYDKATGAEIWQTPLPGPQVALPMTYMHQGRQFVVMAVRGTATSSGAQLVAFALPLPGGPRTRRPRRRSARR